MSVNKNIYELAEQYVAGNIPHEEWLQLKERLATDLEYATGFYEALTW
jgi:hypothetical protein